MSASYDPLPQDIISQYALPPEILSPIPSQPLEHYQIRLDELTAQSRYRTCRANAGSFGLIDFSNNDYLGLANDPRLKQAAVAAIDGYGSSASSSRLIGGTGKLVLTLEEAVSHWKQTEAALVFNSGYQANVAILQAVLNRDAWVFCDRLNHASLLDGCRLSGARLQRYRHLDLDHLDSLLRKAPPLALKWIVTNSIFSMDGDYPNLPVLCDIAERYGALVMVDEAHATGLYGKCASGLCEAQGVTPRVALQMGTFSKALGGFGAYVAGPRVLIDTLINTARGFIYSTALPPAVLAAALAAVEIVQSDPRPRERLWQNVALATRLRQNLPLTRKDLLLAHLSTKSSPFPSPILPIVIGNPSQTLALSQALCDAGYAVPAIRPPSVPPNTDRLRLTLSARHTPEQIEDLFNTLIDIMSAELSSDKPGFPRQRE